MIGPDKKDTAAIGPLMEVATAERIIALTINSNFVL